MKIEDFNNLNKEDNLKLDYLFLESVLEEKPEVDFLIRQAMHEILLKAAFSGSSMKQIL